MFLCYLSIQATLVALRPGRESPRIEASKRVESVVRRASRTADSDFTVRQDLERVLLRSLHVNGPDARLYGYLARATHARKQVDKAEYFVRRALELDPQNSAALAVRQAIKRETAQRGSTR